MLLFLILHQVARIVTTKLKRLSFRWTVFQFQSDNRRWRKVTKLK